MASDRRLGSPDAKNRSALLDAAERIILDEGYAAVTTRRVAARAGLKHQLVHYYFRTMDDLLLDLFRDRAEAGLELHAAALASDQPLRALWAFSIDPANSVLAMEFTGLANHRKAIRAEIAEYAEKVRGAQAEALSAILERYGLSPESYPPVVMAVLLTSLSRVLAMEHTLGMTAGHTETLAWVEEHLQQLEGSPQSLAGAPGPSPGDG